MNRLQEIEARLAAIANEIEQRGEIGRAHV